jgi:hypothetical protein
MDIRAVHGAVGVAAAAVGEGSLVLPGQRPEARGRRQREHHPQRRAVAAADLGSGRIVASEREAPNMLANLV